MRIINLVNISTVLLLINLLQTKSQGNGEQHETENNVESSSVDTQNNNMLTTTTGVAKDGEDEDGKLEMDSDKTPDSLVSTTTVANVTVGEDEDGKLEMDSDKTPDSLVSTTTVANVTVENNVESSSVDTQNNNMLTSTEGVATDVELETVDILSNKSIHTTYILTCIITIEYIK
ncbi:hypothetical protein KSF78_0004436 [Schistosoma japonicum]|nr:hypothetical protein KSF78_0004436 [Schistosoma japonicum]